MRRAGHKVRVSAQLIDARTDTPVWGLPASERELTDVFAVQSEIASAIAAAVQTALSPQEKKLIARRPTDNIAAYDLYLKAREVFHQPTAAGQIETEKQEAFLQAAVQLDPKFAGAWTMLTRAHAYLYFSDYDHTPARLARAKTAADTVVRIDPDSPDALIALGHFYFFGLRDYDRAIEQYEKARRLRPSDPDLPQQIGVVNKRQGRWSEAVAQFSKGLELDPLNFFVAQTLAAAFESGHRYPEAIALRRRVMSAGPEDLVVAFNPALAAFRANGSTKEAIEFFARLTPTPAESTIGLNVRKRWAATTGSLKEYLRLEQIKPNDWPADRAFRPMLGRDQALVLIALGDLAGARNRLSNVEDLRQRVVSEPANSTVWANLGEIEALLGNKNEALRPQSRGVDARNARRADGSAAPQKPRLRLRVDWRQGAGPRGIRAAAPHDLQRAVCFRNGKATRPSPRCAATRDSRRCSPTRRTTRRCSERRFGASQKAPDQNTAMGRRFSSEGIPPETGGI